MEMKRGAPPTVRPKETKSPSRPPESAPQAAAPVPEVLKAPDPLSDTYLEELGIHSVDQMDTDAFSHLVSEIGDPRAIHDVVHSLPPEHVAAMLDAAPEMTVQDLSLFLPPSTLPDLQGVVETMQNPTHRVELWREIETARTWVNSAEGREELDGLEGEALLNALHRANVRAETERRTSIELHQESRRMLERLEAGEATLADVVAMEQRKQREREIEREFGVNLATEVGEEGSAWTTERLDDIAASLETFPRDVLRNHRPLESLWLGDPIRADSGQFQLNASNMQADMALLREALNPGDGAELSEHLETLNYAEREALLTWIDTETKTELESLVAQTTDPELKLQLWQHTETAQSAIAAETSRTRSQHLDGVESLRERRTQYLAHSRGEEVLREASTLLEDLARGDADLDDVNAMIARKDTEAAIEDQYGINLTHDDSNQTERTWSAEEMNLLRGSLDRIPESHLTNPEALREVFRSRAHIKEDGEESTYAGMAGGGVVWMFDGGVSSSLGGFRTDVGSPLAGHDQPGQELTGAQVVLTHEVGHTVHQADPELEADFHDLSGWAHHATPEELEAALLAEGALAGTGHALAPAFDRMAGLHYGQRSDYTEGDRTFTANIHGGYWSKDRGSVDAADPDWAYAATNPSEHFAEIYAKAIHAPESLYQDLVLGPAESVRTARAALEQDRAMRDSYADNPQMLAVYDELIAHTEADIADRQRIRDQKQSQHAFFRERVFGVDDSALAALEAPPGKEEALESLRQTAMMAMTQQQLDGLIERYQRQP